MSKEASRIRAVVDRLTIHEDVVELLKMAKLETVVAAFADDAERFDRSVAIHDAAREALNRTAPRLQAPRYPASA